VGLDTPLRGYSTSMERVRARSDDAARLRVLMLIE